MGVLYIVSFAEHIEASRIDGMISGLAGNANIRPMESERTFSIEPLKQKRRAYLEEQMTKWETYGFLTWSTEET